MCHLPGKTYRVPKCLQGHYLRSSTSTPSLRGEWPIRAQLDLWGHRRPRKQPDLWGHHRPRTQTEGGSELPLQTQEGSWPRGDPQGTQAPRPPAVPNQGPFPMMSLQPSVQDSQNSRRTQCGLGPGTAPGASQPGFRYSMTYSLGINSFCLGFILNTKHGVRTSRSDLRWHFDEPMIDHRASAEYCLFRSCITGLFQVCLQSLMPGCGDNGKDTMQPWSPGSPHRVKNQTHEGLG